MYDDDDDRDGLDFLGVDYVMESFIFCIFVFDNDVLWPVIALRFEKLGIERLDGNTA